MLTTSDDLLLIEECPGIRPVLVAHRMKVTTALGSTPTLILAFPVDYPQRALQGYLSECRPGLTDLNGRIVRDGLLGTSIAECATNVQKYLQSEPMSLSIVDRHRSDSPLHAALMSKLQGRMLAIDRAFGEQYKTEYEKAIETMTLLSEHENRLEKNQQLLIEEANQLNFGIASLQSEIDNTRALIAQGARSPLELIEAEMRVVKMDEAALHDTLHDLLRCFQEARRRGTVARLPRFMSVYRDEARRLFYCRTR